MDDEITKKMAELMRKQIESELNLAIFGNASTASTSTNQESTLSYGSLVEAINKIPPRPKPEFDEIRLSEAGWETMKEKLDIVEEKADLLGGLYLMGCQVLIRDYIPDNMAIAVKRPQKPGETAKIVAIIDLGFPFRPVEIN